MSPRRYQIVIEEVAPDKWTAKIRFKKQEWHTYGEKKPFKTPQAGMRALIATEDDDWLD